MDEPITAKIIKCKQTISQSEGCLANLFHQIGYFSAQIDYFLSDTDFVFKDIKGFDESFSLNDMKGLKVPPPAHALGVHHHLNFRVLVLVWMPQVIRNLFFEHLMQLVTRSVKTRKIKDEVS